MGKENKVRKLRALTSGVLETEHRAAAFKANGQHGSLVTENGLYVLQAHAIHNIYMGKAGGIKVHVSVKSKVLIFWA